MQIIDLKSGTRNIMRNQHSQIVGWFFLLLVLLIQINPSDGVDPTSDSIVLSGSLTGNETRISKSSVFILGIFKYQQQQCWEMVCWYLVWYYLSADNRLGGQRGAATTKLVQRFESRRGWKIPHLSYGRNFQIAYHVKPVKANANNPSWLIETIISLTFIISSGIK